jgi:hypothetical protein
LGDWTWKPIENFLDGSMYPFIKRTGDGIENIPGNLPKDLLTLAIFLSLLVVLNGIDFAKVARGQSKKRVSEKIDLGLDVVGKRGIFGGRSKQ